MKLFCLITFLFIQALGLGINLAKSGQPRNDNYSFGVSLIAVIINVLLIWGMGVFSNI